MIKLLIGGSPCTYWSIAQKNNREVEAEGLGWELFKNFLIAKEKFQPDYFLYENNKSAAQAIKDQISKELNVGLMYINSALVSAQNRQRFYAFNWRVEQPEDRGIMLRDILEYGVTDKEKAYCLKHQAGNARDYFKKHHTDVAFEPVRVGALPRPNGELSTSQGMRIYSVEGKSVTQTSGGGGLGEKTGLYAIPLNMTADGKAQRIRSTCYKDGIRNLVGNDVDKRTCVAYPVKVGEIGNGGQGNRIYSVDGKSVAQTAGSGGLGSHTGLYIIPVENETTSTKIYKVTDNKIEIKGTKYRIELPDGFYEIRKLTPIECERLQTLPDNYTATVSTTQRYKGLGNGWTAEVIIHILNGVLKDIPKDEKIVVLSMYDGIGTGRYCLDKMGFTNVEYHAYEIDKYAIKVAMSNYPDIIQHGDAFAVRENGWKL